MLVFGSDLQFKRNLSFRGRCAYRFLGELYMGDRIRSMHVLRALKRARLPSDGTWILDAGCGQGAYSFLLARRYPSSCITGIEISAELVSEAKHIQARTGLANVGFVQADLTGLAEVEKYDLVYCIVVLEHIEQDQKVLCNFYRAMKPGAMLLVHVPKPLKPAKIHFQGLVGHPNPGHVRDGYIESEIQGKIQAAGFQVESISYPFGYWGSLARELSSAVIHRPVLALTTFPILLAIGMLDVAVHHGDGNGILVTAVRK